MGNFKMKGFPSHKTGAQSKSPFKYEYTVSGAKSQNVGLSSKHMSLNDAGNQQQTNNRAATGAIAGVGSGVIDSLNDDPTAKGSVGMSTASGALSGVAAGAMFGPVGMAVGGVIGGVGGYLKGKKNKDAAEDANAAQAEEKAKQEAAAEDRRIAGNKEKRRAAVNVGVQDLSALRPPPPPQTTPTQSAPARLEQLYSPVGKTGTIKKILSNRSIKHYNNKK